MSAVVPAATLPLLASIPSPSFRALEVGGLSLNVYGLCLAIGVVVAWQVAERRWARMGGDPSDVGAIGTVVVVAGVIGARVYHLFTGYDWDRGGLVGTLRIWEGGLSIWGAVAGGAIAAIVMTRRRGLDAAAMLDAIGPGVALAQAIGRWGNWFNQELYGRPTDVPWALEIDAAHRPLEFLDRETFHPTFLYESLWNLGLVGVILWLERLGTLKRRGSLLFVYLIGYGIGRGWIEALRIDTVERYLGLSRNNWIAIVVVLVGVVGLVWWERSGPGERSPVQTDTE